MQRALSEIVKQFFFSSRRGSTSASLKPFGTGNPSRMIPRRIPVICVFTGISSLPDTTVPIVSPARTSLPISFSCRKCPAAGEWITRSAPYPPMIPGMPVLAAAQPEETTAPAEPAASQVPADGTTEYDIYRSGKFYIVGTVTDVTKHLCVVGADYDGVKITECFGLYKGELRPHMAEVVR